MMYDHNSKKGYYRSPIVLMGKKKKFFDVPLIFYVSILIMFMLWVLTMKVLLPAALYHSPSQTQLLSADTSQVSRHGVSYIQAAAGQDFVILLPEDAIPDDKFFSSIKWSNETLNAAYERGYSHGLDKCEGE